MGVEYASFLCSLPGLFAAPCEVVPDITYDQTKTTSGSQTVEGSPFVVYSAIECDLIGGPYTDQARAKLLGGEEVPVAQAVAALALNDPDLVVLAGDLSTVQDAIAALGDLEQYAAENYAGLPIIHMSRKTATILIAANALFPQLDGSLITGLGTPVAASGGYPDDVMWVTGQVHLWRTPVTAVDVPAQMSNQAISLAERTYMAAIDCLVAVVGTVP